MPQKDKTTCAGKVALFTSEKQKAVTYSVFGVYLILLVWIIIFKLSLRMEDMPHLREINLIPFHYSTNTAPLTHIKEVVENILIFIPFGVYMGFFMQGYPLALKILPPAALSFTFELIQYIFAIGMSDITDLMGNTFGGLIGMVLYYLMLKLFKGKTLSVINTIGIIGQGLLIAFFILVLGFNR